jgi:hypothetical protein
MDLFIKGKVEKDKQTNAHTHTHINTHMHTHTYRKRERERERERERDMYFGEHIQMAAAEEGLKISQIMLICLCAFMDCIIARWALCSIPFESMLHCSIA